MISKNSEEQPVGDDGQLRHSWKKKTTRTLQLGTETGYGPKFQVYRN
jgi:hypothetical protein